MKRLYLIFVSQEYESANHKELWSSIAKQTEHDVVIVNIPADRVVSTIKGRKFRLVEAKKGFQQLDDNLFLIRPIVAVRPEMLPTNLYGWVDRQVWKCLKTKYPDIDDYEVDILVYNAYWVQTFKGRHKNVRIAYYLYDEVRLFSADNSPNKRGYIADEYACKNSDTIFTMTKVLAESRQEYNNNIVVLGNGASPSNDSQKSVIRFEKSIAFIGNFRDWIDTDLLSGIIAKMPDIMFVFAGPVEENMKQYLDTTLNIYPNTFYYGRCKKEEMPKLYKMFGGVIIPYKDNDFIRATRPIKIVESVFAGTPVVTVPMDGYKECRFIRFARDVATFTEQINYILKLGDITRSGEYEAFLRENSWTKKAAIIVDSFERP